MAAKRSRSTSSTSRSAAFKVDELAVLLPRAESDVLEVQSLLPSTIDVVKTKLEGAGQAWSEIMAQVSNMLATSDAAIKGYEVEAVTVKIGIDAEGSLGVITVGGNAGFEVTFKRRL